MIQLALFASGRGSNVMRFLEYFQDHEQIQVALIVSNRAKAPVLTLADKWRIPTMILQRQQFFETEDLLSILDKYEISAIVLAGFLWLVPPYLVQSYPGRIINIHPALLPHFGGKGMYGMHVHRAVKAAGELVSGITIHEVNEQYDDGRYIFQAQVELHPEDTPEQIADKVLSLEHYFYPRVVEQWLAPGATDQPI